jgi:DNA-binding CsgD family transcriptional regulator
MNGSGFDLEERTRTLALFEGGRRLLEAMSKGAALTNVLEDLCSLVEGVAPGCRCTVLLVEPGGARMQLGAAGSLPDTYNRCFAGRPAKAEFGPCGMAAVLREQVIVQDISTDERWREEEWAGLALGHGLRACWSTPILSPAGVALGTFALYWPTPQHPGSAHQHVIHQMTYIAAVAIERERTAVALARSRPPAAASTGAARTAAPAASKPVTLEGGVDAVEIQILRDRYASLTPREREVMAWVVAGLPNKRICAELGTAEITIKAHRGRVMRKMRAESLAELVRIAVRLDVPLPGRRTT